MVQNKPRSQPRAFADGRLQVRPKPPTEGISPGIRPLHLEERRDGFLYVPASYQSTKPAPLILLLHGAAGDARQGLAMMRHLADEFGFVLLAVDSRYSTWDVIGRGYGVDVAFIDRALDYTFTHCAIDPDHIGIGGFSDGASYALSLGLINGDLFTHVMAFSPGFIASGDRTGSPKLFISHGVHDQILPIDRCSRAIVNCLHQTGNEVLYQEFDGPHIVPPGIAQEAIAWFLQHPIQSGNR